MPRLPTRDDLSQAPSARSGRPIATYDTTAIGEGQARGGKAIQAAAADLANFAKQQEALDEYDAETKAADFIWDEQLGLDDAKQNIQPGQAGGFANTWQPGYASRADTFIRGLPEAAKPKVRAKLKAAEKLLFRDAAVFGRTEQKRFSLAAIDDFTNAALPTLDGPERYGRFLENLQGRIDGSPWLTPIQKDEEKRARLPKLEAAYVKGLADRATRLEDVDALDRDLGFGAGAQPAADAEARLPDAAPEEQASKGVTGAQPEPPTQPRRPVGSFAAPVNAAIAAAAQKHGVDPGLLATFARIESSGRPGAQTGSYKGLFQLSDSEFRKHGGEGDIFDAGANADAAAAKLKVEASEFQAKHGRAPTALDLYLVHQQGEAGYASHMARPDAPAWQNMASTGEGRQKGAGWAKKAIWGNIPDDVKKRFPDGVESVTSQDFIDIWGEKVARFGGGEAVVAREPSAPDTYTGPYRHLSPEQRLELSHYVRTRGNALAKIAEEERKQTLLRERADNILTGRMPADPGSKVDRGLIDQAFEATDIQDRLNAADPAAAAQVTAFVKHTGYVPEMALSELRAMSVNGSAEQQVYALETAANLLREKPGALEGSEKSKALKDDASLYEALTMDAGIDAKDALSRIQEMRSPEFAKRREAFKQERDLLLKDVKATDLTAEFDGWFSSAPALGGTPSQGGVVLDRYRELVGNHYVKTGDIDIAKAMAKKDLQRTYAVSEITGNKRFMRHPPENYYPLLETAPGQGQSRQYFSDQLKASVNEYVGRAGQVFGQVNPEARATAMMAQAVKVPEIPLSDIFIEPVPQTNSDISAGRYPGYAVSWIERRDGIPVLTTAPGFVFRADVKGAQQNMNTLQEARVREQRQQMLERDRRYDEAPLRPLGKPIEEIFRGERKLPTETGEAERLLMRGPPALNLPHLRQPREGARLPGTDEEMP